MKIKKNNTKKLDALSRNMHLIKNTKNQDVRKKSCFIIRYVLPSSSAESAYIDNYSHKGYSFHFFV